MSMIATKNETNDQVMSNTNGAAGNMIDTGGKNAENSASGIGAAAADDNMSASNVEDDQNYQFYKEYCRLYYANIILTNRLQQLLNEKKDLQFKLSRLEVRREQR